MYVLLCGCVAAWLPGSLPLSACCQVNASHTLHHLSFGPEFDGMVFPLDGVTHAVTKELSHFQCVRARRVASAAAAAAAAAARLLRARGAASCDR